VAPDAQAKAGLDVTWGKTMAFWQDLGYEIQSTLTNRNMKCGS
jgi:hypothetical protein